MRKLQSADAEEVFEFLRSIYSNSAYPMGGSWTLSLVEKELENGFGWALVTEDGKINGVILARKLEESWDISFLGLAKSNRGKGQMDQFFTIVREKYFHKWPVWLEVHELNLPALNLYKRLGFRQVGRRLRYYRDGAAAVLLSLSEGSG